MTQPKIHQPNTGINPFLVIMAAIALATAMVVITTVNFLHSGAYNTVKQIQIGVQTTEGINQSDLDVTSPINALDINEYAADLEQRLNTLDNYEDFGPEAVSDASLGL
jgi:hypothetical protein